MGGGSTKLLNNFVIGAEEKEEKLAKAKVDRILTSGALPKKTQLIWQHIDLYKDDDSLTMKNLLEAAEFIHKGRSSNQNTLVVIQPKDPDSVIFATAYIMALSGLSPKSSKAAVERALEEYGLKFNHQYDGALELLHNSYKPKALRAAIFEKTGPYPEPQLIEDVCRIYELSGLIKPTDEQIRLEVPIDETRRLSLFGRQLMDIGRRKSKDANSTDPSSPKPTSSSSPKPELDSKRKSQMDAISESLRQIAAENASKTIPDELVGSLKKVNDEGNVDLPKILNKIKKRGELIVPLTQYMKPDSNFENWTLTDVQPIRGQDTETAPIKPPVEPTKPPTPAAPKETSSPSDTMDKKSNKKGSILDHFIGKIENDIVFDNDTFTDSGASKFTPPTTPQKGLNENDRISGGKRSPSPVRHELSEDKSRIPTTSTVETTRKKITIIRAYTHESSDSIALVDEYLNSTTEEERRRNTKPVIIIRAFSKQISVTEE